MAKPQYYPDWATLTVTLPGTGNTNKIRPKETIRNVGMDFGQIMTCEEMNWTLNNFGLWIHYLVDEFIPTLPQTYLPLVGTKITMAGDATGNVTWNGNKEVTLSIQVVDNSHNHLSANITDAAVGPTANVLPKRDTNGSMYAGNNMYVRALGSSSAANFIMQNSAGTQIGYVQATVATGGSLNIVRNNPSNGANAAHVILYDGGYVGLTSPRTLSAQDTVNGNALIRLDYLNSRLSSLQTTLQTSINNVQSSLQGQITNNLNYLNGNFVRDVRLGSEVAADRYNYGSESFVYRVNSGYTFTGINIWSKSSNNDEFRYMYSRPIQKNVNGTWYTVGQL